MIIIAATLTKVIDLKDYSPGDPVKTRESARAIIMRTSQTDPTKKEILMVYIGRDDYYSFPGGGIEAGENPRNAVIREIKEETGYNASPWDFNKWGVVTLIHKNVSRDSLGEKFIGINHYFIGEVKGTPGRTNRTHSEIERGLTHKWVEPELALETNRQSLKRPNLEPIWRTFILRENAVLEELIKGTNT